MLSRRALLLSAGATALAGCATPPSPLAPAPASAPDAAGRLSQLMDAFFQEMLDDSPERTTGLGLDKGERAAARSQLDNRSIAALEREKARTADQLARLRTIDRTALSGRAAIDYDAVRFGLETSDEAGRRFAYGYAGAGAPYVISQMTGAYQGVPSFLDTQHVIETEADAEAYLSRLDQFDRVLDEEAERARRDADLGAAPPDFIIDRTLQQIRGLITAPRSSPLVRSVADRAKAKGLTADYETRAAAIYAAKVAPAVERQIVLLSDLRKNASPAAGVWRLPDGEAYYALSLKEGVTSDLPAEQVHQMGLDQARALGARADAILRSQGMTKGSVGARIRALYEDRRHHYPNTDSGKERLVADLNALVAATRPQLADYFGTLPKAPVEIRRVPKFIEAGAPGGYYNQPSLDGSRPGVYWINLRDSAEVPKWTLPTLTYHEAVPGHHLQLSIQQEVDLPMLRRATFYSAYGEGWALYSEQLMQEAGVYVDDPLGEVGYLQAALFRAARLVVDTGLHAKRWSRKKAVETMVEIAGMPRASAVTEVERYCIIPGQACSYMVGKLTWLRLREKARAALGARFDIRAFHDAGLACAAAPLTVLESVIDGYIATAGA